MKKLQSKNTDGIGILIISNDKYQVFADEEPLCGSVLGEYDTLDALMQEWEDYEEPRDYWFINDLNGMPLKSDPRFCKVDYFVNWREARQEIGNYFETEEEAKKAVEKLKAWKRLKEKGARFNGWFWDSNYGTCIIIGDSECSYIDDSDEQNKEDLDLLFGGEE